MKLFSNSSKLRIMFLLKIVICVCLVPIYETVTEDSNQIESENSASHQNYLKLSRWNYVPEVRMILDRMLDIMDRKGGGGGGGGGRGGGSSGGRGSGGRGSGGWGSGGWGGRGGRKGSGGRYGGKYGPYRPIGGKGSGRKGHEGRLPHRRRHGGFGTGPGRNNNGTGASPTSNDVLLVLTLLCVLLLDSV